MARTRKTEPEVIVSAAAPARRKTQAASARKTVAAPIKPSPSAANMPAPAVDPVLIRYSPTQNEIAALAYSYWANRGCQGGSSEEDWLRAERELAVTS